MKNVISISSHVAYGAVGNRIIVPALEALGISVTAVNTIQLPWHPGMNARFGSGTRIVPEDAAFAAMIDNLVHAPWLGEINGLITGYLGSPNQATAIAKLIAALKHANSHALYLCDPVIGDTGGLYVPEATAVAIRDNLWPVADIVTPNLFEFGWMTGHTAAGIDDVVKAADTLNKRHIIVTSMNAGEGKIGNLWVSRRRSEMISHDLLSPSPNGTGDMLSALFMGHILNGVDAENALAKSAAITVSAIKHANTHQRLSLPTEHLRRLIEGETKF